MGKDRPSASSPNEHLKRERLLRNWTQADVAGFLGTDGYTVNRWERGRARPGAYFGRKLCELFGKDAHELGLVPSGPEASDHSSQLSSGSLPGLWSVPHLRNPYFTGRAEILQTLHTQLAASQTVALIQSYAVHGLGGVGKTQLALEYAYRYAAEYQAVFWIEAESGEQIMTSLLHIAELLQIPEHKEADQQRMVAAVRRWLTTQSRWLLIWDNLEDLELLRRLLPPVQRGAILITTRSQALGTLARGVDLTPMGQEEGLLFLLRRAKMLEPEATDEQLDHFATRLPREYAAAEQLVTIMGGLPLALDQAGAYVEETGCNFSDYLLHYEQQRVRLLDRRGFQEGGHPHSVTTTIRLTTRRITRDYPAAADLLCLCALLGAESIPEELFGPEASQAGALASISDLYQLDQAIAVLRTFSLVQRHTATHTLSIHRLVQAVVQDEMSEQERALWLTRVIAALDAIFPDVISDTWERCERLLPHVLAVAVVIPDDMASQALARVVRKAADYHRERVQYEQARQLYQRALRIWSYISEADPEMARSFNGLGLLAWEQGQYDQAEELYQQALLTLEQTLGPAHPDIARPLNNLAILYTFQGKYAEAAQIYHQALSICEQTVGLEHPRAAYSLVNLAEIYREQGRYEDVQPLCERALRIWQQAFGAEHSLVAYPLATLANLARDQERYAEAEAGYQQVLAIWEKTLGLTQGAAYPFMAEVFNGLAYVYTETGKPADAESWYRRALSVQVQTLGMGHPDTADTLNGLANLYAQQGKKKQARRLFRQALHIRETRLGSDHPKTAQTLHDLAIFVQAQGDSCEALTFLERALSIRSAHLGLYHPKTIATRTEYLRLTSTQEEIG